MIVATTLAGGTFARADAHTFADVMRRAHEYAVIYEDHELSTIIARERYQQQWLDAQAQTKAERLLMSDFLIFQLPPHGRFWVDPETVVPIDMQERYDSPRRPKDDVVVARATYSDFRPFDWRTLVPPPRER